MNGRSCDPLLNLQINEFFPYEFIFNENSHSMEGSFKIRARDTGCFIIKISTYDKSYDFYDEDTITLNVKGNKDLLDPAQLTSVSFENDGLSILLRFNSKTDMKKENTQQIGNI